jgi:hypothetical protein
MNHFIVSKELISTEAAKPTSVFILGLSRIEERRLVVNVNSILVISCQNTDLALQDNI